MFDELRSLKLKEVKSVNDYLVELRKIEKKHNEMFIVETVSMFRYACIISGKTNQKDMISSSKMGEYFGCTKATICNLMNKYGYLLEYKPEPVVIKYIPKEEDVLKARNIVIGHPRSKKIKDEVMLRDLGLCRCCGESARDVHHIIALFYGGEDKPENMVALCYECHLFVPNDEDKEDFLEYANRGGIKTVIQIGNLVNNYHQYKDIISNENIEYFYNALKKRRRKLYEEHLKHYDIIKAKKIPNVEGLFPLEDLWKDIKEEKQGVNNGNTQN